MKNDSGHEHAPAPGRSLTQQLRRDSHIIIGRLQDDLLRGSSTARGVLAGLRSARRVNETPFDHLPLINSLSPEFQGTEFTLSRAEQAMLSALHLYAIHQQSQQKPMHVVAQSAAKADASAGSQGESETEAGVVTDNASGIPHYQLSLAGAVLKISDISDPAWMTRGAAARLIAGITADSHAERLEHFRACVRQLRSNNIPLDYGQLAADLWLLSSDSAAESVRLRWSRHLSPLPREQRLTDEADAQQTAIS